MIYADCNSGRGLYPEVADKISSLLGQHIANPSQILSPLGQQARELVEQARVDVADLVGADPNQVIFTSGATESCFQAILGCYLAREGKTKFIRFALEHPAVVEACETLKSLGGVSLQVIDSSNDGQVEIEDLYKKLDPQTFLVNLMAANNETGVCFPWQELALACSKNQIPFHCDITQWIARLPFSFRESKIDLVSFSSHKIGGPQGVGALVVRSGAKWKPAMPGGGQQNQQRGGTEAVVSIAGFGEAAKISKNKVAQSIARDKFESLVSKQLAGVEFVGKMHQRLPNTSLLIVENVAGNMLVESLAKKGIIISSGSACNLGAGSRALEQMGYSERQSRSAIRISFERDAKPEQAKTVAERLCQEASRIRLENIKELKNL